MRRWVIAAVLAGMAQGAQAADLPDLSDLPILRGGLTEGLSKSSVNWQGAYVGGQFGYSSGTMDFGKATKSLSEFAFRNTNLEQFADTTLLGKSQPNGTSFGGFVGWNSQWDDVVLGIEANYNRLSGFTGQSQASYGPVDTGTACGAASAVDVCTQVLSLNGQASAKVTDVLTLRGRAGWAIDNFMPYMFGGVALGRADIFRSVIPANTAAIVQRREARCALVARSDPGVRAAAADHQGLIAFLSTTNFTARTMSAPFSFCVAHADV